MKVRPQGRFHKQMKPWLVESAERTGWIKITCPHKDCGGVAFVKRGMWLHGARRRFIGRSCTYCFKTAKVPVDD